MDLNHPETFDEEIAVTEWEGFTGTVSVAPAKGADRGAKGGTVFFGKLPRGTLILCNRSRGCNHALFECACLHALSMPAPAPTRNVYSRSRLRVRKRVQARALKMVRI